MHQCFGHARPYPCLCISILIMQGLIFTYTPQPCKGLILVYASTLLSLNLAYVPLPCKASSLFMHQYFRHSRPHLCLCIQPWKASLFLYRWTVHHGRSPWHGCTNPMQGCPFQKERWNVHKQRAHVGYLLMKPPMDKPSTMGETLYRDEPIPCENVHFKRRGVKYSLPQIPSKMKPFMNKPSTMIETLGVDDPPYAIKYSYHLIEEV